MAKAKPTGAGADVTMQAQATTDHSTVGRDKALALATHVLGLLTLFLGPLVLYLACKRKANPWLRDHLAGSTNDGLLTFGLLLVLIVLLVFLPGLVTPIALVLLLVLLLHVVARGLGIAQAARARPFHVPLVPRLVR